MIVVNLVKRHVSLTFTLKLHYQWEEKQGVVLKLYCNDQEVNATGFYLLLIINSI